MKIPFFNLTLSKTSYTNNQQGSINTEDALAPVERTNPSPLLSFSTDAQDHDNIKVRAFMQRILQDIRTWYESLKTAEIVENRWYLWKCYRECILDPGVSAAIDYRNRQLLSIPTHVIEEDGETENEELTKFFNEEWMYKMLINAANCKYWGPGCFQIDQIYSINSYSNTLKISEIMRPFYNPQMGFVNFYPTGQMKPDDEQSIDIRNSEPYMDWMLEFLTMEGPENLGLLNKIMPWFLYKKLATQAWADFAENFGVPWKLLKTDIKNEEERRYFIRLLKDMGKSASIVMKKTDELTMEQPARIDAYQSFKELIQLCDSQIQMLILGSDKLMSSGGAKGLGSTSSKEHSEEFHKMLHADQLEIQYWVNNYFKPRLINLGILPEGNWKWEFESQDNLSTTDYITLIQAMGANYTIPEVDLDAIFGLHGVKLVVKPTPTMGQNPINKDEENGVK